MTISSSDRYLWKVTHLVRNCLHLFKNLEYLTRYQFISDLIIHFHNKNFSIQSMYLCVCVHVYLRNCSKYVSTAFENLLCPLFVIELNPRSSGKLALCTNRSCDSCPPPPQCSVSPCTHCSVNNFRNPGLASSFTESIWKWLSLCSLDVLAEVE